MAGLPAAPCTPHWLSAEREERMQVNDLIRKTVAFVGQPEGDHFAVFGTAFFVGLQVEDYDFFYLVTARHVVWPGRPMGFSPSPPEGKIYIRVNEKSGPPREIETDISEWIFHEQVKSFDICCYPFSEYRHNKKYELDISFLNLQSMVLLTSNDDFSQYGITSQPSVHFLEDKPPLTEYHYIPQRSIMLGDEVFLAGAFVSHIGRKRNIPVIRTGTIAAIPEEPVEWFSPTKPAYLVETRSIGGFSGSPVFLHLLPDRQRGDIMAIGHSQSDAATLPYSLIGMVLGNHTSSRYVSDIAPIGEDIKWTDVELNSGLTVVMPVSELLYFLYSSRFVESRAKALNEHKQRAGHNDRI